MPTSEAPPDVNEPNGQTEPSQETGSPVEENPSPTVRGSRWVDYDTHELLEMISELEDERRWARLREGVWIAVLVHLALLSALTLIPKYLFKVPPVVDRSDSLNKDKEFTYLDTPRLPKVPAKPALPQKPVIIDKKTLEDINKTSPPAPAPPAPTPAPAQSQPQPTPPIPPAPQSQSQIEAPRPSAVPARPNFAMNSDNPADTLRKAMENASRSHGSGEAGNLGPNGLPRHPGAGSGGVQVLSDTQGVDFSNWLQRWHHETENTWDPLIPDEVNPPLLKSGMVAIRFKVLPNGRLMDGSLILEGRSGDTALDRAAWGALTGSNYPPLPRDFHGPYLELRAFFLYNEEAK
jgi:hypothetical protein